MPAHFSNMRLPRFPLLPETDVAVLIKKSQEGDKEARERLINCNLKLVFNLVQRFENRGYESEDLFQIGTIGLMKAIDKFNPAYEVKFSTYAVPMIIGEIRRFLRDDSVIRVSRSLKETAFRFGRARESLRGRLGREPTVGEVAEAMGVASEELIAALEAVQAPSSINETIYQDEGDPIYMLDHVIGDDESSWFENIALREVLKELPPRQRQVIFSRYFEDKTQVQVARELGISQVQVSRLERRALTSIRELLTADSIDYPGSAGASTSGAAVADGGAVPSELPAGCTEGPGPDQDLEELLPDPPA